MSGEHPKYLYESWLLPYKPVVPNTVAPTDDNHVYQYYNEKNRQRDKINRRIVSKEELETDKYWWDSNGNPYLKSSDYSYSVPKDESVPSISKSSPNTNPEAKYDLNPDIASSSNLKSAITAPGAIISMDTNLALKTDVTHNASPNTTPAASFIHSNVAPASKLMSAISNPKAIPSTDTNLAFKTDVTPKASPNITSAASAIANPNIASSSNLKSATSTSVTISLMNTNSATPTLITEPTPNPSQPIPNITSTVSSISATESNLTAGPESFASTTSTTSDVAASSANILSDPKANTTSMAVSPTTTILATKLEDLANTSVIDIPTPSAYILPASKANPASITPKSRPLSRRRSIPGLVIDSDLMSKLSPKSGSSISPVLTSTATIPAPIITAANISVTEDTSAPMTDSSISSVSAVSSNVTSKIAVNIFSTVEAAASVAILPTSQSPAASDALTSITEPQDLNAPSLTTYLASISKPLSSMHIGSKAVPAKKAVAAASFISASLSAHKPDSNDTTLTSTAEPVPTVSPAVSYNLSDAKTISTATTVGGIPNASTKPAGSESIDCTISDLIADISSKVASTSSDILIPPSTKAALSDSSATSITAITTSKGRPILSGTTASTVNDTPIPSAKTAGDSPATSFISAIHASIGPKFISAHSIEPDDSSPDPSEKSCKTGPKFQPRLTNYQRKLGKLFETPISSSSISKAEKMMLKMGWSGGALGKQGGGIIEPITPNLEYVKTTKGLGRRPTEQPPKPTPIQPMPNPAKRFKKTESSNPCLNIIKANIKRRMLKKPEETKEQKKSRKQQTRLEKARRKNLFKNNVLLCILEFVINEREIGILFDDQLHSGQRKIIHDIVEKIRNAEAPENKHTRGLDQALLSNVARKNRYMLQTQSEGVMPKRRLCLFKEAPKSMYLVTHYMLNDRKTDYVKLEEDQNVSQAKKYKQIGLARKQRLIDAKQRKKAKQLRKALKRAQKVNADKVEVEINIDEYKFVKDEFDNYVARKITDIEKSDAKEIEADKIKQNIEKSDAKESEADKIKQNSNMDQPMSDYDEDMLEDYFKSSDEDVEMTKPESREDLKAIFRIEDKKDKAPTAAQNINVKKTNETQLDVDNNNKLKKVEEKYVIKTRKDFLRHNLNKCFAEFLNGEAFIEFKFLGQFDTEEYEVMNEFLNYFFMAKSSNKVTNEEFSDIWKSGDWNLGYKRDLNGGLMIYKVTNKTE